MSRYKRSRSLAKGVELSLAVPQVIAMRTARMLAAGVNPSARDRREFDPIDVREIRRGFGQTRGQFADMLGISRETLRNWERGRRWPVGPSRALLRIAAADPDVVAAVLLTQRATWGKVDPTGDW